MRSRSVFLFTLICSTVAFCVPHPTKETHRSLWSRMEAEVKRFLRNSETSPSQNGKSEYGRGFVARQEGRKRGSFHEFVYFLLSIALE